MIRRLIALTALAFCVAVLAPSIASAHHTTTTCIAPATWQIVNSEPIAMTYTTDAGHSGSIGPNGSDTVTHSGTSLTVYGVWANGQTNTSTGEGQCQSIETTSTTVQSSTTTTTEPSTTTTSPSTTETTTTVADTTSTSTTTPEATSTTVPTTTPTSSSPSTTQPEPTTSSSVAATSTSSTSLPPASTQPEQPTTSAPSSVPSPSNPGTLPATGNDITVGGTAAAAMLIGAGLCLYLVARRRQA